jgi:predicted acyl esterase
MDATQDFMRMWSFVVAFAYFAMAAGANEPVGHPADGDIPTKFEPVKALYDFEKREVMIPMRDGVKLFTVIVIPKGASRAPIILDRTPYSAAKFATRTPSMHATVALPLSYGELAEAGYVIVIQDVRGKYK